MCYSESFKFELIISFTQIILNESIIKIFSVSLMLVLKEKLIISKYVMGISVCEQSLYYNYLIIHSI